MTRAGVVRRDDGAALRALRVGVHPEALVVHVGTDVVVRTPGRPDHRAGNVVDLLAPPDATTVEARLTDVHRLMAPLGVPSLHLRYELPTGVADDVARVAALVAVGCTGSVLRVLEVGGDALPRPDAPPADVGVERLAGPDGDVVDGRRWYAASVLDRYAHGDDVTAWRGWDAAWGAWDRERVTALARAGRAEVWMASRHGMPVAALTLLDDRDGLAVVEGVVTHPAHRRRGIARALLGRALASLADARRPDRVALAVSVDSPGEALARDLGFAALRDVHAWSRPA